MEMNYIILILKYQLKKKMESKAQINCSCSLISIKYKFESPKKIQYQLSHKYRESRQSTSKNKKSKISLSRSTQKNSKQKKERETVQTRPSINFYNSISNKFGRTSIDQKIRENNKVKKKFLVIHKQQQSTKQSFKDKQNKKVQTNKNIGFVSSFQMINDDLCNKHRFTELPPSYQMRRIEEQLPQRFERCDKDRTHFRNDGRRTIAYQSQNIKYNSPFGKEMSNSGKNNDGNESGRRIRPLKQLQYRNVRSSGKMTSENQISMVRSSASDLKDLQGLASLIQKTSSTGFRLSRNSEIMI